MGLDMFLFRRKNSDTKSEAFTEVGFWRKANHIHNWFVVNCQDGVDECQETEISKEKLEELLSICKKVLNPTGSSLPQIARESIAEEFLPTVAGFFFGGTDYDQYYYDDVSETIDIIEKALAETDFDNESIYYSSSW